MHTTSYEHMTNLVNRHLQASQHLRVLDIGSYDVNGTYRPLFSQANWQYTGLDLSAGPNVDVVLKSPYRFPFPSGSVDLVISGQAFEHVEFFWLSWLEMVRVLRPGGHIFLIAPSKGPEHRCPVDCWRFYPDGFRALAKYAGLRMVEVHTDWELSAHIDGAAWGDTVGVFQKSSADWRAGLKLHCKYWLNRLLTAF